MDDMSTNRAILNRRLTSLENQHLFIVKDVVEAGNGKEAIDIFSKTPSGYFDLILMDCLMPIVDGFDATRQIHHICDSRNEPRIPAIAVTASATSNIQDDCENARISCVITNFYDGRIALVNFNDD